ncbi:MAG: hypothetical protein NZ866_02370, partial [Patescibacteria group bacterium]|nr:hypothetical protein [Patescibacteria group bacterium]
MNNINFLDQYISAPQSVRDFIFSDEYYSYLEEYLRKFEIDPIKETDFVYFLQDLIFKLFVPKSIMELKDEIIRRFNLEETKANQMA